MFYNCSVKDNYIKYCFAFITQSLFYFLFFINYTNFPSVLAYFIIIGFMFVYMHKLIVSIFDIFVFCFLFAFLLIKLYKCDFYSLYFLGKFYFGFLVFYLYFKRNFLRINVNLNYILLILSVLYILEAICVNTVIPPSSLPNYPDALHGEIISGESVFVTYNRPYGIGSNPSISSSFLVVLLSLQRSMRKKRDVYDKIVAITTWLAVFSSGSGTGYICLFIYSVLHFNFKKVINYVFPIFFLVIILLSFEYKLFPHHKTIIPMLGWEYFELLVEVKIYQSVTEYNIIYRESYELLFGQGFYIGDHIPILGDSGWIQFVFVNGLVGLFLISIIIVGKIRRHTWRPILILVIATIHYPTFFIISNQILFAYMLSQKSTSYATS